MSNNKEKTEVKLKNEFNEGQHVALIRYAVYLNGTDPFITLDLKEHQNDVEKFYAYVCFYYEDNVQKYTVEKEKIDESKLERVSNSYLKFRKKGTLVEPPPVYPIRINDVLSKYNKESILKIEQFWKDQDLKHAIECLVYEE